MVVHWGWEDGGGLEGGGVIQTIRNKENYTQRHINAMNWSWPKFWAK